MTLTAEIATILAQTMIARTGVGVWEDQATRDAIGEAALDLAQQFTGEANGMANKIYAIAETAIVFGSEVGDDVALSSENIANDAGRQSALHDLGARTTASADRFHYRGWTQAQATPTVNNSLDWYLKTSDGSHPDNDDGTGDAAVSAEDKLQNLHSIDSCIVDEAAANIEYVCSGAIYDVHARHVGIVMWNAMGSSVTNDAAETKFSLTPMPPEVQ